MLVCSVIDWCWINYLVILQSFKLSGERDRWTDWCIDSDAIAVL